MSDICQKLLKHYFSLKSCLQAIPWKILYTASAVTDKSASLENILTNISLNNKSNVQKSVFRHVCIIFTGDIIFLSFSVEWFSFFYIQVCKSSQKSVHWLDSMWWSHWSLNNSGAFDISQHMTFSWRLCLQVHLFDQSSSEGEVSSSRWQTPCAQRRSPLLRQFHH